MLDTRFPANNMFTAALHTSKVAVLEFLLDRDMVDISTCCRRPLESSGGGVYSTTGKQGQKNRNLYGTGHNPDVSSPVSNMDKHFLGVSPTKRKKPQPNMASFKLMPASSAAMNNSTLKRKAKSKMSPRYDMTTGHNAVD